MLPPCLEPKELDVEQATMTVEILSLSRLKQEDCFNKTHCRSRSKAIPKSMQQVRSVCRKAHMRDMTHSCSTP